MSSIDTRVVEAKFDNKQFESGIKTTLSSLDSLKSGLKLEGATKGLENVSTASSRFSLGSMMSHISGASVAFGALSVAAVTAFATIVSHATMAGVNLAKSFTVKPLMDGLHEYETNLNSIQTILANTGLEGKSGLAQVNGALQELNTYSDQTIYNFSEMARNIGTFTAAGVKLDVATGAIKGIANLAAVSGSSSEQASTAMYQLSQAMSTGTVKLMDWNSVVNAGMGGKVFQEAIKETARAHGVGIDAIIKKEGSFRDSLQTGWLSSGILTETLQKFTGDMSAAQLKQLGYTDKQIAGIIKMGKTAKDAATKVKTFSQLMGTLKEAAGSGWTQTWQLIIGDFDQARNLWTNVNNVLGGMIAQSAKRRNDLLAGWNKLGGRDVAIQGIANAFHALLAVLKPIKDAFREIFPPKTAADLMAFTKEFANFTKHLIIGSDTADKLKRIFAGLFAAISIVKQVISGTIGAVVDLFKSFAVGSGVGGGILDFFANIGDTLVYLDKTLKSSNGVHDFFNNLEKPMHFIAGLLTPIIDLIRRLFGLAPSSKQLTDAFSAVGKTLTPLQALGLRIKMIFSALAKMMGNVGHTIGNAIVHIGDAIGKAITPATFDATLSTINTALLGGIVLMLKKFFSKGMNVDLGGGFLSTAKDSLEQLTKTMGLMQTQIKANIIMKIAIALAVLTASIYVLSTIDGDKLAKALLALGVGFMMLQGGMVKLSTAISGFGAAKLAVIAAAMIGLSISLTLLAVALKIMSTMNFGEMMRGLVGFAIALKIISTSMAKMPKNMVGQAAALTILGVALSLIALSLKVFATMSWSEMAKGMAGLASALTLIAVAMRLMPKNMVLQATALAILGAALTAIGLSMKIFATMSWTEMGKGLAGVAGALVLIAGAMTLMPQNMLIQSVALIAVATALNILGAALLIMGNMSWAEIGKGLATLAGSMLILAVGLAAMSGSLAGSAALLVAAGALAVLTPVLVTLGSLDWTTIIKALTTLAGVFVILGLAGLVLGPLVPVLIGLGAAMVLIGAGFALAGVGAMAFATAFGIVVGAGMAGVEILRHILETFVQAIPAALKAFGLAIIALAVALAKAGPQFTAAFITIMSSILNAIIVNAPKIGQAFLAILNTLLNTIIQAVPKMGLAFLTIVTTALNVLVVAVPRFAAAGMQIILGVLTAIAAKLPQVIAAATDVIVAFINGLTLALPRIIDAGAKLIISFINGVADAIRNHSEELGKAGGNMATAIIEGMIKGLGAGLGVVEDAAKNVAKHALNAAKDFLGIHSPSREFEKVGQFVNEGFAKGLTGSAPQVQAAYDNMKSLLHNAMKSANDDVVAAQDKLAKLTEARRKDNQEIARAAAAIEAAKKTKSPKDDQAAIDRLNRLIEARDRDTAAIAKATLALQLAKQERDKASAGYNELTRHLGDETRALEGLANKYDVLNGKMEVAKQALEDAIKTRDDYKNSIANEYDALPDINSDTTLTSYLDELNSRAIDTTNFAAALQQLRNLGLSDEMYKELLAKGLDAMPFVQEIIKGGAESVDEINKAGSALGEAAKALGSTASTQLYQAGVDAAQGLVRGIASQEAAIQAQMDRIANGMVQAVKSALGIKSPSRVFMKLGAFSSEGMAQGLRSSSASVEKAAGEVGLNAVEAMRKSIFQISDVIDGNLDLQPTIAPILDLSSVQKESLRIGSMLTAQQISVDAAYAKAKEASAGYRSNQEAVLASVAAPSDQPPASVSFTQNNYSPKALSQAEIYRQTNNQLSKAKGALKQ